MNLLSLFFGNNNPLIFNLSSIILSDYAGYSWFSRPRSLSHNGFTYIGVVANFGTGFKSGLIRINEANDNYIEIPLSSATESDDHNEASIIYSSISSKYIAAYCEHVSSPTLRWRLSSDGETWETEKTINTISAGETTYSALFEATNGDIYYLARIFTTGLTGGWYYSKSTDGGESFSGLVWFLDIFQGASYPIMNQDTINKNIIHIAATEFPNSDFGGHTDNGLWYGYFDLNSNTFYNSAGASESTLPIDIRNSGTQIDTISKPDEFWIEDVGVSSLGYARILYTKLLNYHNDKGVHKQRWYIEWNGNSWSTPYNMGEYQDTWSEIGTVVSDNNFTNPELYVSASTYSSVGRFNDRNVDQMFLHKFTEAGGKTELYLVTRNSSDNFTWSQLTFNSSEHQWRANSIASGPYKVYWLNARDYRDMKNFDMDLYIGKL